MCRVQCYGRQDPSATSTCAMHGRNASRTITWQWRCSSLCMTHAHRSRASLASYIRIWTILASDEWRRDRSALGSRPHFEPQVKYAFCQALTDPPSTGCSGPPEPATRAACPWRVGLPEMCKVQPLISKHTRVSSITMACRFRRLFRKTLQSSSSNCKQSQTIDLAYSTAL